MEFAQGSFVIFSQACIEDLRNSLVWYLQWFQQFYAVQVLHHFLALLLQRVPQKWGSFKVNQQEKQSMDSKLWVQSKLNDHDLSLAKALKKTQSKSYYQLHTTFQVLRWRHCSSSTSLLPLLKAFVRLIAFSLAHCFLDLVSLFCQHFELEITTSLLSPTSPKTLSKVQSNLVYYFHLRRSS